MPPSETTGDADFSGFESGLSEYASADSNVESAGEGEEGVVVGVGDAADAVAGMTITSSNNNEDEFFDAFVDADVSKPAVEGDDGNVLSETLAADEEVVVGDVVDKKTPSSPSVQHEEVNLFNATTGEDDVPDAIPDSMVQLFRDADSTLQNEVASTMLMDESATTINADTTFCEDYIKSPPTSPSWLTPADAETKKLSNGSDGVDAMETTPSSLTTGDFDSNPLAKTEEQAKDTNEVLLMEGGDNGGCDDDPLSAFDAMGVQDAPLPSLDSFPSSANNEENKPEVLGNNSDDDGVHIPSESEVNGILPNEGNGQNAYEDLVDSSNKSDLAEHDNGEQSEMGKAEVVEGSSEEGILPIETKGNELDFAMDDSHNFGAFDEAGMGNLLGTSTSAGVGKLETSLLPQPLEGTFGQVENGETVQKSSDDVNTQKDAEPSGGDGIADTLENNIESGLDANNNNDFGAFTSIEAAKPGEDMLGQTSAGEIPDDMGRFSIGRLSSTGEAGPPVIESIEEPAVRDDDFGGFLSPEDGLANPPAEEGAPTSQPAPSVEVGSLSVTEKNEKNAESPDDGLCITNKSENIEVITSENAINISVSGDDVLPSGDDFGGFAPFEDDILPVNEQVLGSTDHDGAEGKAPDAKIEEDDDFGGFAAVSSSADDGGVGNFDAFKETSDKTSPADASVENEQHSPSDGDVPSGQLSADDEDDEFGDFGGFASPDNAPLESVPPAEADPPASQPSAVVSSVDDDDDFGGFAAVSTSADGDGDGDGVGSFDAFKETSDKTSPADTPVEDEQHSPSDGGVPLGQPSAGDQDDEFGDFGGLASADDAPSESVLPPEDDDFGGFAAVSSSAEGGVPMGQPSADNEDDEFGYVGGLASPEDTPLESLPPAEEDPPASQPSAFVSSVDDDDEFGSFGEFNEFEESPGEALPDVAHAESDQQAMITVEEEQGQSSANDGAADEFGDFGGFNAFEESPNEVSPESAHAESDQNVLPTPIEAEPAASEPSGVVGSVDDGNNEFGSFGDFNASEETPDDVMPSSTAAADSSSDQKDQYPAEEEAPVSQPIAAASSVDNDDEFGDFGDFNAFEETEEPLPSSSLPAESDQHAPSDPAEDAPSAVVNPADIDDEFGEFGDFDATEEASPESAPTESGQFAPTPVQEEVPASQPTAAQEEASGDDDEFGDFGDFEEFEEAPEEPTPEPTESDQKEPPTPAESAPRPALSILNESARLMFQNVFETDTPIASDLEGKGTGSELPFDFPMSNILPKQVMPPKAEDDPTHSSHQSEQELATMKKFFNNLPRSPPLTILSDEKWYPYSQYEFHRDGSPYADSVERVTTPSVPEVLSINLPTGFEASNLSPSSSSSLSKNSKKQSSSSSATTTTPPRTNNAYTPTVVDFPTTPKSGRNVVSDDVIQQRDAEEESDELEYSTLSETGKRFMEQLPDLSYMLKSTLSLPNGKK